MSRDNHAPSGRGFRTFFLRGLGFVLPTVLTIWLVIFVYNFINENIARHINGGVQWVILEVSDWPSVSDAQVDEHAREGLDADQRRRWIESGRSREFIVQQTRLAELQRWWNSVKIGKWAVLDLTGLLIAVLLIYFMGRLLGGYMGRRMYERGERFLVGLPVFKQVYPHVKQVTDLFFGDGDQKMNFSRVVAVQYPRKGIWSVGLVTGETMRDIQDAARADCMTVFIPSSPTPFTGYVITVPKSDTLDLPISIDEALRFCVSGGVIVPNSQAIEAPDQPVLYVDGHSDEEAGEGADTAPPADAKTPSASIQEH